MTSPAQTHPTLAATQRFGYVVAVLVNVVLLYGVNVWPSWQVVPFLTGDFTQVLQLINLSLAASIVANLVFVVFHASWVRPLGDLATTGIAIAATVRMLQVFPFAFDSAGFDWSSAIRIALVLAIVGTAIAMIVQLLSLVRAVTSR